MLNRSGHTRKSRQFRPILLFPLLLIAFVGPAVSYVNVVFNTSTRWLVLVFVLMYLLHAGKLFRCLNGVFGLVLFVNILWCLLTWFWSEAPELTGLKAIAFAAVAITTTSGGIEWARTQSSDSVIAGLAPLTFLALFAGIFGFSAFGGSGEVSSGNVAMYRGLTGNSNMLGSLAAMGFSYALWRYYLSGRPGTTRGSYFLSVGLLAAMALIELRSMARTSFLSMACISMLYLVAQGKRRLVLYVLAAVFVAGVVFLVAGELHPRPLLVLLL